jgi:hypothetical protein
VVDRKAADRVIGKASWEVDRMNMEVYMAVVEGCSGVAAVGNTHMVWERMLAGSVLPQRTDLDVKEQH